MATWLCPHALPYDGRQPEGDSMGAWDTGTFSNDDAQDWIAELLDSSDLTAVDAALGSDMVADYVEAPDGARVLAASEVLAALKGRACPDLPKEVHLWVEKNSALDPHPRLPRAAEMTDRILSENSELRELWSEDEQAFLTWTATVQDLRGRLLEAQDD
jgi:hypothetical protein